jgi:hypothetical protein
MNLLRSPKSPRGGSQPDLSKLRDEDTLDKPQITFRKRKEPDPDLSIREDIQCLRNDMKTFLVSFSTSQNEIMSRMQQDMTEIKNQLCDIRVSTNKLIEDQHNLKTELNLVKTQCAQNEIGIKCLRNDMDIVKSSQPSSSQSQNFPVYEKVLTELQDRTQRQKNIIIVGIPELTVENKTDKLNYDTNEVLKIIQTIDTNCPEPLKIFRIGKLNADKPNRPIKACFETENIALNILRKKGNIKTEIKIFSDQTRNQQHYLKCLREELSQRQRNGEENLFIKYIKGNPTIVEQPPKN